MMGGYGTAADGPGHNPGTCDEALRTLYHFLDGELTDERTRQIQRHLDECSPCLGAFDFEAELKVVVAKGCRDTVPERLRLRVAAVIAEAAKGSSGVPGSSPSGGGLGDEY